MDGRYPGATPEQIAALRAAQDGLIETTERMNEQRLPYAQRVLALRKLIEGDIEIERAYRAAGDTKSADEVAAHRAKLEQDLEQCLPFAGDLLT